MSAMANPKVQITDVSKTVSNGRHFEILKDINFDIKDQEFVCLVGPSGCGKSTLLNLLAGFDFPTTGRILVAGKPIHTPDPTRMVVFQEPSLFPWLTTEQNLAFGLTLAEHRGTFGASQRRSLINEHLQLVGLGGFEKHYMAEMSGGMKQRLEIARALIMRPQILLMDEPFGALDAQTRILMQQLLLSLWERFRQSVLFITHDIDEAILLGDVVHVMSARPGRIKKTLPVLMPRPRSVDVMTSPQFNEIKVEVWRLIREESERAMEMQRA
jgi:NitT/TauT family transport system ATP-binding protein/sulfonate transport system ATP-binding protein